jgi:hypothetical protein
MKKLSPAKKWFAAMVVLAFASVISFFQVDSAWADANNFNTGLKIAGTVLGLGAIFSLFKVTKNSN